MARCGERAQGFTWLLFLAVLFFLPYALSIAERALRSRRKAGQTRGTRLAFGLPAAVNSVIYWVSNPIWVGGSLTIVTLAALGEFFTPISGGWQYVYAVVFIWFTIGTAIVSLQYGKWVPTAGAWARGAVLVFFVVSVALYAARHGLHGFGGHAFRAGPGRCLSPWCRCCSSTSPGLAEVPSAAGEEMTNPRRDVPFSIGCVGFGLRFSPTGSRSWRSC